jgi:hypothetical protein
MSFGPTVPSEQPGCRRRHQGSFALTDMANEEMTWLSSFSLLT